MESERIALAELLLQHYPNYVSAMLHLAQAYQQLRRRSRSHQEMVLYLHAVEVMVDKDHNVVFKKEINFVFEKSRDQKNRVRKNMLNLIISI